MSLGTLSVAEVERNLRGALGVMLERRGAWRPPRDTARASVSSLIVGIRWCEAHTDRDERWDGDAWASYIGRLIDRRNCTRCGRKRTGRARGECLTCRAERLDWLNRWREGVELVCPSCHWWDVGRVGEACSDCGTAMIERSAAPV